MRIISWLNGRQYSIWSWKMMIHVSVFETSQAIKQWAVKMDLLSLPYRQAYYR